MANMGRSFSPTLAGPHAEYHQGVQLLVSQQIERITGLQIPARSNAEYCHKMQLFMSQQVQRVTDHQNQQQSLDSNNDLASNNDLENTTGSYFPVIAHSYAEYLQEEQRLKNRPVKQQVLPGLNGIALEYQRLNYAAPSTPSTISTVPNKSPPGFDSLTEQDQLLNKATLSTLYTKPPPGFEGVSDEERSLTIMMIMMHSEDT